MEDKIFEMATTQGIWAVLFVSLFLYTLRDSKQRETKYQDVITKLSGIIETELSEIKSIVKRWTK
jgi:hypothetical protein